MSDAASGPDPGSFGGHPYTPDEIALGYGTDHDPRDPAAACVVDKFSSRSCERSTKGCTVHHAACWCCGEPAPIRGDGDPWEGRLDGYCESCASTRCDTTDSTCAVKGRPAAIEHRRGLAWGWTTPNGQRFYGIDFGRFAVGVLLNAPILGVPLNASTRLVGESLRYSKSR